MLVFSNPRRGRRAARRSLVASRRSAALTLGPPLAAAFLLGACGAATTTDVGQVISPPGSGSDAAAAPATDDDSMTTGSATTNTTAPGADAEAAPGTEGSTPAVEAPDAEAATATLSVRPDWLGTRTLPTTPNGRATAQTTPAELEGRRFATIDTLVPPTDGFNSTVDPLAGEPLQRSTWRSGCPVPAEELRYVTVSFWGFDGRPHQGELILNATVADDIVGVFRTLYDARYPIEEMRIVTQADLDAPPIGDGNNTSSFSCREVVGGTSFSEHAFGLAIDINPFHNPYIRDGYVLPELATFYLDRSIDEPAVIADDSIVVQAFDELGWGWGGRWNSLKDYQHFSANNR